MEGDHVEERPGRAIRVDDLLELLEDLRGPRVGLARGDRTGHQRAGRVAPDLQGCGPQVVRIARVPPEVPVPADPRTDVPEVGLVPDLVRLDAAGVAPGDLAHVGLPAGDVERRRGAVGVAAGPDRRRAQDGQDLQALAPRVPDDGVRGAPGPGVGTRIDLPPGE